MAEEKQGPKGVPTPRAPQNQQSHKAKLYPNRIQACLVSGSGGVKRIGEADYFSFVADIPGGTLELLWPFDSTPAVIENLNAVYHDALKGGVGDGKPQVVLPDDKSGGVVDLAKLKGSKRG